MPTEMIVAIKSNIFSPFIKMCWRQESNLRPDDYKSTALPTELRQRKRVIGIEPTTFSLEG